MAKPIQPKTMRGYTLIEILIVLFIISIVTSVALLSIGRNENKRVATFANELMQTLTLAEEQAILQPIVLGLSLQRQSLQFKTFEAVNDKKKTWVALNDAILTKLRIPTDIQVDIEINGQHISSSESDNKTPQIIISTNGDVTPFTIYVGKKGEHPRYAVIGEADGNIINKALS